MISLITREHNGAVFHNFYSDYCDGVACLGEDRHVLNGQVKFTIMTASYKFDPQLQISVYAPKGSFISQKRNSFSADKWDQIEIDLPLSCAKELLAAVSDHINKLEVVKSGEESD